MQPGLSTPSRRSWLLGASGLFVPGLALADNAEAVELIRERGKKAGMEGFDESESTNFEGSATLPSSSARKPWRSARRSRPITGNTSPKRGSS